MDVCVCVCVYTHMSTLYAYVLWRTSSIKVSYNLYALCPGIGLHKVVP